MTHHQSIKEEMHKKQGFTLIELLVVIAIFLFITGVVLLDVPRFRAKASLDLVAQEISLHIRGAQVYGLATKQSDGIDYSAYGMYFSRPNNVYLYGTGNPVTAGRGREAIETYRLVGESLFISDLQLVGGNSSICGGVENLSIVFERPETKAIFFAGDDQVNCNQAIITLKSVREENSRQIVVYKNGQITVRAPILIEVSN